MSVEAVDSLGNQQRHVRKRTDECCHRTVTRLVPESCFTKERNVIRIRFHGRGGHGVKTASRIVGTAAFMQGYVCQDSPVYGAERRGAAVAAYNRIGQMPILERGTIADPDLIIVADETLLNDPTAGVLAGQESAAGIFLNCATAAELIERHAIHCRVFSYDVTDCTSRILGRASALSAGSAAAASRLCGIIPDDVLEDAMRKEFAELHVPPADVEKNIDIAREIFGALPVAEFARSAPPPSRGRCARINSLRIAFPGHAKRCRPGKCRARSHGDLAG